MNALISEIRSAEPANECDARTSLPLERRRIDVTGLPASRLAEYLQASGDEVHFERVAGKTYAVAGSPSP